MVSGVTFILDHLRAFVEVLYCYPENWSTAEHPFSGTQLTESLFCSRHSLITELGLSRDTEETFSWGQAWKFTFGARKRAQQEKALATKPDEQIQVMKHTCKGENQLPHDLTHAL